MNACSYYSTHSFSGVKLRSPSSDLLIEQQCTQDNLLHALSWGLLTHCVLGAGVRCSPGKDILFCIMHFLQDVWQIYICVFIIQEWKILGDSNNKCNWSYCTCCAILHSSHLRVLGGQCCCSSQCSSSGCWAGPLHCGSRTAVRGERDFPVWCRYGCAALGHLWRKWRPCRLRQSHTGTQSSRTGQWYSYTAELQRWRGQQKQQCEI